MKDINGTIAGYILVLFLVGAGATGCDVQRGRFSTTEDMSAAFASDVGCIEIVSGHGSKPFNTQDIDEQNLLYLVIICPNVRVHGSGSGSDYGKYITILNHSWDTDSGVLSVQVRWDRRIDNIYIGKSEFIREKGDVFVVELRASGEMTVQQLPNLDAHADFHEVLRTIQRQLPDDKLIASLQLTQELKISHAVPTNLSVGMGGLPSRHIWTPQISFSASRIVDSAVNLGEKPASIKLNIQTCSAFAEAMARQMSTVGGSFTLNTLLVYAHGCDQ